MGKRPDETLRQRIIDSAWELFYEKGYANTMINEMIRKKIKATPEQVPYSLHEFGNTSMASIPLTIVTQLKGKVESKPTSYIACGFGVGLSWGTVSFRTDGLVISDLVEL